MAERIFTQNDRMVELIRENYHLLPVINRFGIKLGFGDKKVSQVCEEKNINLRFFLAIINTFNNPTYFPENELLSFSPDLIVDYLRKTHKYYINYVLPKMESLLRLIKTDCLGNCKELNTVESFYKKYKEELVSHINEEEEKVFPYVLNLSQRGEAANINYSITSFEKEHNNVETQVNDLKNIIIKYLPPNYDENLCNEFLATLFQFEKDILDHARIEDHILVPQVVALEKKQKNEY